MLHIAICIYSICSTVIESDNKSKHDKLQNIKEIAF